MNEKTNVATLIQRLVDSDLTTVERKELLAMAGIDNLWKPIALAYMETQALDKTLGSLNAVSSIDNDTVQIFPRRKPEVVNGVNVLWRYGCIAATATALLLMLYSGSWLNQTGTEPAQTMAHVEVLTSDVALELEEALARSGTPVPERFKLDLLHAGYLLSETKQVADVNLPFGGTVQMPIRTFDIQYLGQAAYQ